MPRGLVLVVAVSGLLVAVLAAPVVDVVVPTVTAVVATAALELFALTFVVIAVFLYCDRDTAPVFGHISPLAGTPHR